MEIIYYSHAVFLSIVPEDDTSYASVLNLQSRFSDTAEWYLEIDAQEAGRYMQRRHCDAEDESPRHDETNRPSDSFLISTSL